MADLFDKEELGIVGSLFGTSPEGIALAREQQAYKQGISAGPNLLGGILGQTGMFAERGGQALRGVLGQQNPEERIAALRQQAQQNFDPNTPQGLAQMAQFLNQNGDAAGARQAVMLAQGQQQQQANLQRTQAQTAQAEAQGAAAEAGKLIQIDAGDKILIMNALTKQVVREIPKGMSAAQTVKQEAADAQKTEVANTLKESAIEGRTLITKLRDQVGLNTVGVGSALSWLPMTDARKFAADLDTLKSQLTLAAMNAAKSQSKTGATGFGALNKEELKVLQTNISKLDTGLSPDQFNEKLDDVLSYFDKLETKASKITQPTGSNLTPSGEFADDYAKYKEKYKDQAMPYNAYVFKRKGS